MRTRRLKAWEVDEQTALFDWADRMKGQISELALLFAVPNSGGYCGTYRSNKGRVLSMLRQGVKPGVPDIFLPVARGSAHGLFIELKRKEGGAVSREQHGWMQALAANGYAVCLCYGFEEAKDAIERYLGKEARAEYQTWPHTSRPVRLFDALEVIG